MELTWKNHNLTLSSWVDSRINVFRKTLVSVCKCPHFGLFGGNHLVLNISLSSCFSNLIETLDMG